jgi:hypothetical protein
MTDGGAAFQPGQDGQIQDGQMQGRQSLPFRPRSAYVGHEVFGRGEGAVLVEPEVTRDLRSAAESANQERRITGGLLYGRAWTDDEGAYLVVDGFLEAEYRGNRGDLISRDGDDSFTLSAADLRPLREDATRMYSAALEVGWWRSLAAAGGFGPQDFLTQRELVRPGGVGLLVFASGLEWGTAYLGPDGQAPGPAGSLVPVPRLVPEPEPEPVTAAPGTALTPRRQPVLTPAPQPTGIVISPIGVPAREWGVKPANLADVGPKTPTDVKIVVGALFVVAIVAAIIIGALVSNALVAVIAAVIGFLLISGFVAMSRL